jgi:predicted nucleic acid-binding protein
MKRMRIYVDTSVIGGTRDEEFAEASNRLMEKALRGEITILVSTQVMTELYDAPDAVRAAMDRIPEDSIERVRISPEVVALAEAYIEAGIVGPGSEGDAKHVAAATVSKADVIVSWNFRHIVNFDRIRQYNVVNVQNGYAPLEIRTPSEMVYDDPE